MRHWFLRVVTFVGLVGTVTGLPWYATLIWSGSYKDWFGSHALPILFGSGVVSLVIATVVDRITWADRLAEASPRILRGSKRDAFVQALRGHTPHVLIVSVGDDEAHMFAQDLQIATANAGWHSFQATELEPVATIGLHIKVSETATEEERAAAVHLRRCLKAHGFRVVGLKSMPSRAKLTVLKAIVLAPITLTIGNRG
jgi:hypothetical protein